MSYEQKFKGITRDSGMGVYGQAELLGREADKEIANLKSESKQLKGMIENGLGWEDMKQDI